MATRRTSLPPPQPANLTIDQMKKGIGRLERLIPEIEAFDSSQLTKRFEPVQTALQTRIKGALDSVFGHGTVERQRYSRADSLDHGAVTMYVSGMGQRPDQGPLARKYVEEGKREAVQVLREAIQWLKDEITDAEPEVATEGEPQDRGPLSRKIFVVHGHDDGILNGVARFVDRIGFEPIILREQANQGRTIIEKIEANSDVGFAIVLLTPDDVGGKVGAAQQPRARQNVLLELGYFIGVLGRSRVCTLSTGGGMEIPTDFAGVIWQIYDDAGGWKNALALELQAAGYEIDWNKVMKPT